MLIDFLFTIHNGNVLEKGICTVQIRAQNEVTGTTWYRTVQYWSVSHALFATLALPKTFHKVFHNFSFFVHFARQNFYVQETLSTKIDPQS
jgi:hypothetical protein